MKKFLKTLEKLLVNIFISAISVYQKTLSPDHGPVNRPTCRFTPTCSEYTKEAFEKWGLIGGIIGTYRIIRCNPIFTKNGTLDKVPNEIHLGRFVIRAQK